MFGLPRINDRPRNVRLDTLVRLRWLAVLGQFGAVLVVHFGLEFEVPIWACLAVIALSALLNVALRVGFRETQWLAPDRAAPLVRFFVHYDLPWDSEDPLQLPEIYMVGVWLSILLAIGYIGVYTWQVAEEARQLSDALAATELVLAREQHLSQLDGLAAAAAHELGTPLSTITVVVREIERALDPKSPHAEDVKLLREQAQRCREILAKITELPTGEPFDRTPLSALIEEAVAPHRNFGISIGVTLPPDRSSEPSGARNPAIRYGLGNLIEDAVDFAHRRVEIFAQWTDDEVSIIISDDGPGFAPEVVDRLGAPYVTHRRPEPREPDGDEDAMFGLGLGFFIAKTLLERSGAKLAMTNQAPPLHGATISVTWSRADFERPLASPPLEPAAQAPHLLCRHWRGRW